MYLTVINIFIEYNNKNLLWIKYKFAKMSSTRKVTIDSGRRIATGDALDSSKKKSVFERLGGNGSTPKSVVKTKISKKISSENQSEDEDGDEKEKRKVSFTVKKNSLVEDSENKLKKKKQETEEDITKPKKKKKQKVEGASLKPKKNLDGLLEEGNTVDTFVRKKKKKILSPTLSTVKKKKKALIEEEQEPFPLKKNSAKPPNDLRKIQTDSSIDQEDSEKKKKKIKQGKQSPLENIKKIKKNEISSLSPTKKKVKSKISDDENNFDKLHKKQNKPSLTSSDDDDDILHKKKIKKGKKQIKTSVSLSPIKDLSSFDSDSVGLTSESEHDERVKKRRKTYHFNDRGKETFYERSHFVGRQNTDMQNRIKKNFRDFDKNRDDRLPERRQNQIRQYDQEDLDNRRHDDFHRNKRTDQYNSDDRFTSRIDNRQTYNHYNKRNNDYNQLSWHDNDCDERRTDMRFDDRNHNMDDRCNNRNPNNRYDYRDTRDNIDNQRDYYREDKDFRSNDDHTTDWNHDYADNEHYNNRGHHFYRGRGRGYRGGRGNFRGNYSNYNNNDGGLVGRYNQRTSPTHRDYDNYNDVQGEYLPERSARYDYHDNNYHKDVSRSKERKFELSPIRDPNFIGSISRKRELSEETDKRRKRKHEISKKKSSKDKGSESEITDDETKKKKAKIEKPTKDLKENDHSKVSKKITPSKQTVREESPKSTKTTKDVKQKVENDDKSKEKKLISNKKLPPVKDPSVSKEEKITIKSEIDNIKKDDFPTKRDEKNLVDSAKNEKRHCKEKSTCKDESEDLNENRKSRLSERTGISTGWSSTHSDFRKGRSPVRSNDSRRSPAHSTDSRKDRSPESRDSYKRGWSPVKYDRRRSPIYNRDAYRRESYVFDRNKNHDVSRSWERNKSPNNRGDTPSLDSEKRIIDCLDVYESISDEELDLFDDNDEEFPQPASVLEVDWSLLQNGENFKVDKESESLPEFKRKLCPGNILAEIGYSPSLLKKSIVERVQDACFSCMRIESRFLEPSEEVKLQTGMAATVRKVFKNRSARKDLFLKCLTGLKNDLALRRELRKPVDKIGSNSTIFYSAPSQPADYDLFLNSVDLYDKKECSNGYPLHISLVSKVGSVIICKS
ncbi:uncharacterized protein DDB_G0283697 isoform X3 [Hydra vulgaris]|uniref:uncharacterized protein DDB_G0283697 isoform X3 n=1 Tax=Hydra vulgaris TaxID=6087 RepID=UPI0032EA014C